MTLFEKQIIDELFDIQDVKYRDFHARLVPEVAPERIIGVCTPQLRKYARAINKDGRGEQFLSLSLPLNYYEEMNLYAFLIEQINDYDTAVRFTDGFLPYIDNWATCDFFKPKVFRKYPDKFINDTKKWLAASQTYTVRYGVVSLLGYLDDKFSPEYLEWAAAVCCDEYYINMAVAWYFSMAILKQYEATLPYIKYCKLPIWVHNKAIQKACESKQIDAEIKKYLKTLKLK